jgi:hypothetical protein
MREQPSVRLFCHCTICQAFTGEGFSDVMMVRKSHVKLFVGDNLGYKRYKKHWFPPPNLARGRCRICGKPVLEAGGVWPVRLFFLPAKNFVSSPSLAAPEAHMFYEHRLRDHDDGVPKHEGYFDSQGALVKMIMKVI